MNGESNGDVINLDDYRQEKHPPRTFRDLLASDMTDTEIETAVAALCADFETEYDDSSSRHQLQTVLIALDMTESPLDIPTHPDKYNPGDNRNRARHMLSIDRKIATAAKALDALNIDDDLEGVWHELIDDTRTYNNVLLRAVDHINARIGMNGSAQDMWRLAVVLLKTELEERRTSSER